MYVVFYRLNLYVHRLSLIINTFASCISPILIVTEMMIVIDGRVVTNFYCLYCGCRHPFVTAGNNNPFSRRNDFNTPNAVIRNLSLDDMPTVLLAGVIAVLVVEGSVLRETDKNHKTCR